MEAERQSHNVKEFGSDLTALSDPHWQARRQFLPGIAADAYGTSEYPHKRQAVVHGPPDHPCMDDVCCAHSSSQPVHPPARVLELQCCTEPALMQQMYQQSGREQQSSLHSSVAADAASAEAASSGHKHASRPPAYPAEKEQSKAGASLSHSSERQDERPAEGLPPAAEVEHGSPEQEDQGVSLVMDDDGGYVIPVLLTDMDIRMPVSMPARVPRSKAEPEAQAGRPRRSRAAALACQATIAEMVRDEEEDAILSAVAAGKEPPRSEVLYASFGTSEDDEDGPARSKSRRRRKPEPSRQRPGVSGRSSRPGSTTASPIKVQILEPWSPEGEAADTPGMSVVGPLHGPKNRLTPSAAPCPLAAWALQGYSGSSQEVELKRLAEWIGETARSGGLVSAPFCFGQQDAAARDWQSPAVEKRYRACFARIREVTHNSMPDTLDDTGQSRRSTRVRTQPDVFVPSYSSEELAYSQPPKALTAEDTDMLLGEDYQAVLPKQLQRPAQPTPEEQQWLQHKVLEAGQLGTGIMPPEKITSPSGCVQWRIGSRVLSSKEAHDLGLPSGSGQWLDADINCFASCLARCGKDFGLIAQQLQPPKSRGEVVCFYYDMWKTRRIPRARQWYNSMKAEVQEEDFADKASLDAAARHRASVVKAEQRRQIKNALMWLRETVRQPLHLNVNRVKVLERLHRLRQVLLAQSKGS